MRAECTYPLHARGSEIPVTVWSKRHRTKANLTLLPSTSGGCAGLVGRSGKDSSPDCLVVWVVWCEKLARANSRWVESSQDGARSPCSCYSCFLSSLSSYIVSIKHGVEMLSAWTRQSPRRVGRRRRNSQAKISMASDTSRGHEPFPPPTHIPSSTFRKRHARSLMIPSVDNRRPWNRQSENIADDMDSPRLRTSTNGSSSRKRTRFD